MHTYDKPITTQIQTINIYTYTYDDYCCWSERKKAWINAWHNKINQHNDLAWITTKIVRTNEKEMAWRVKSHKSFDYISLIKKLFTIFHDFRIAISWYLVENIQLIHELSSYTYNTHTLYCSTTNCFCLASVCWELITMFTIVSIVLLIIIFLRHFFFEIRMHFFGRRKNQWFLINVSASWHVI